jgi:PAS domain S-box-containing protein
MIDFFEFSNEMLCLADHRGYFTRVNQAWTKTLGWSAAELTNRPYLDFIHPDDRAATIKEASLLQTGSHEVVRFENRYRCRDGSYRWLAWHAIPESNSDQIVATARDVTVQKLQTEALRESEERFRTLITRAPVGIVQVDANGSVFVANEKWCELAGVTPAEALGFSWKRLVHPEDLPGLIDVWQRSLQSGPDMPSHEFRFVHKNGEIRWASSVVTVLNDAAGKVTGQIVTVQDITARKAAHDALLTEQELLRQSLELQERERKLFAYDLHDGLLQYAIGALLHFQACQSELKNPADAERIEPGLQALRQAIEEGRRVMNGVRTYVLDQFGVTQAIEELVKENTTANTTIEFVRPANDLGRLTPEWETAIYRIAQEAITNAVKHSQSPNVRITLEHTDQRILLEVRDWGIGTMLKKDSRGVHGLPGIKERVKLLKGRFKMESSPDGGTRLEIELPMLRPSNGK